MDCVSIMQNMLLNFDYLLINNYSLETFSFMILRYLHHLTLITIFSCFSLPLFAQKLNWDKSKEDSMVYECLNNHLSMSYDIYSEKINPSQLIKTEKQSVYMVPGDYYHSKTISSSYYVRKIRNSYVVIYDKRFPVETFVNQLLNRVQSNHILKVKHHQYGHKIPMLITSLKSLFALFLPTMKPYVSNISVNEKEIEVLLIFHHPNLDFIHMLTLKTQINSLFDKDNVLSGDFYTNIPQDNLKSLINN